VAAISQARQQQSGLQLFANNAYNSQSRLKKKKKRRRGPGARIPECNLQNPFVLNTKVDFAPSGPGLYLTIVAKVRRSNTAMTMAYSCARLRKKMPREKRAGFEI
jgi:hypothetical protein